VDFLYSVCCFYLIQKIIFLKFSLALPRPLYSQNIYARNIAIIVSILGFVGVVILLTIGYCVNKTRQSGHYKTKEDKGADQAIDADTAIIKGDPRHPDLTEPKEWFF
jgi:hypothetical protein